jgi:hypothetical protein
MCGLETTKNITKQDVRKNGKHLSKVRHPRKQKLLKSLSFVLEL